MAHNSVQNNSVINIGLYLRRYQVYVDSKNYQCIKNCFTCGLVQGELGIILALKQMVAKSVYFNTISARKLCQGG